MPEQAVHGSAIGTNGGSRVSFSDVARAHYAWDKAEDDGARRAARADFEDQLRSFEARTGETIVDAYWCTKAASAVALTRREPERRSRLIKLVSPPQDPQLRLYRLSDWVTADTGEVPDLLHECDVLALKAAHVLEGTPQAVVMQWLLAVESHVLGFIERAGEKPPRGPEIGEFVARQRAELRRVENYYQQAGEKRGRLRYTEGMLLLGVVLLVLAGLATAAVFALFGVLDLKSGSVREFFACAGAGGMGAVVSVLMRMTRAGGFVIDHELGRLGVTLLGAYRPLLGAVSGIIVYFLVQTTLLPIEDSARTFAFYVVVAFLAGFSERWTQVVIDGAMSTVGGPHEAPAPEKDADEPC